LRREPWLELRLGVREGPAMCETGGI